MRLCLSSRDAPAGEGSAALCWGPAQLGGCYTGSATAVVFSLLQLIFESDPEDYELYSDAWAAAFEGQIC